MTTDQRAHDVPPPPAAAPHDFPPSSSSVHISTLRNFAGKSVAAVVAGEESVREGMAQDAAVDCILQHTATHCSTLQHTAAVAAEEGSGGIRGDVAQAARTHAAPAAATIASSVAVADVEDAACSHAHADTKLVRMAMS